ncbi:hypothetical protein Pmar_PMAR027496 [Perkinsus marinus ATCC 50983]|uniref:CCHC-type domain-containing protein n=1 Tax=Perkinsus marinus (strain ATCC 50983 / TXsc) TaxID=423536 RepID=C5L1N0_PERM5|nr:hypothetical protein Pmar_PMAR027496 [Perkinsus marinus ATCC 50983]EER09365.1 hypothetical protein Pmar_PMAR027496 [Perkinsus marinus ATCC 50983]|eukprot:XP_002777549.1 hypothetical protein Pmar_PMAR027496 [Perkinsus marinus ATCC 50983]
MVSESTSNMQLKITPVSLTGSKLTIAKIEGWFKKFETIAKFYNWGEKAYEYVPLFLEDKVQVAYDHIPLFDRTDLNKVKASLIHSLLTQDPFEAFNSRVMNDDESYLDFSYDLKQLAQKMLSVGGSSVVPDVADALARSQFLRGIDVEMAEKLRMLKLQTLDEMVERAKTISRGKEISDQRKQELSFYAGYYSAHYEEKGKGKGNYNVKGGYESKGVYLQKDPYWFNRCYSCGRTGHLARDCPVKVGPDDTTGMLAIDEDFDAVDFEAQDMGN